jgi:hypothetical protein
LSKKRCGIETFFSTTPYAALPYLGVFKPGALHPVTPAPIKALQCLCFFPPMAEKPKPPAPRVVGGPEHYYGKRYKTHCLAGVVKLVDALDSKDIILLIY